MSRSLAELCLIAFIVGLHLAVASVLAAIIVVLILADRSLKKISVELKALANRGRNSKENDNEG